MDGTNRFAHLQCFIHLVQCCSVAVKAHSHLHPSIRLDQHALSVIDAHAQHTCAAPPMPYSPMQKDCPA
eukprot:1152467-Pelagomonas_calceolata.AAC.5